MNGDSEVVESCERHNRIVASISSRLLQIIDCRSQNDDMHGRAVCQWNRNFRERTVSDEGHIILNERLEVVAVRQHVLHDVSPMVQVVLA